MYYVYIFVKDFLQLFYNKQKGPSPGLKLMSTYVMISVVKETLESVCLSFHKSFSLSILKQVLNLTS